MSRRYRQVSAAAALVIAFIFFATLAPVRALAVDTEPDISEAQCAIVVDSAGNVLWSKNADQEMSMASITKVMTAVVALESGIDLDSTCTISDVDLGSDSQTAGFTSSDTPTMRQLLQAMLVYSGNDAALNVAINVAGSEDAFVDLMNEKAAELGMTHTHFTNPHGLYDANHYSCASDLVTLGRYALENFPFIASTVRTTSITLPIGGTQKTLSSTDDLMGVYEGMLGIKTGYVDNQAAFLGACRRNGVTLYTCVLGCSTTSGRFTDTEAILDWAYDNFVDRPVSSSSWVIDVRPYALNFGLSTVTHAVGTTSINVWPDGDALSYSTVMARSDKLLDSNQMAGSTTWSQGGRPSGTVRYYTSLVFDDVPSFNIFALPLFMNTSTLGAAA